MSHLTNAIDRLTQMVDDRMKASAPFRAIVTSTSGNKTYIRRITAATPDAEPYTKSTADTFAANDEVLCLPLNGKPVIIGKIRR